MHRLLVASRYLLARPISFVAMLVFIVAVVALVLVDSIMGGFLHQHELMLRGTSPDVAINFDKALRRDAAALELVREEVRAVEGVAGAGLRRSWPVLYRREDGRSGLTRNDGTDHFVHLLGMDLDASGELDEVREMVRAEMREPVRRNLKMYNSIRGTRRGPDGEPRPDLQLRPPRPDDPLWFDPADPFWRGCISDLDFLEYPLRPILFGEQLALDKGLFVGQVVKAVGLGDPDDEGYYPKKSEYYVVAGAFRSEDDQFEDTHAILDRAVVLEFCDTVEHAEELAISVSDQEQDDAVRDRVVARLAALDLGSVELAVGVEDVETWRQRKKLLLDAVANERIIMNVVLLVVVGVAGFALLVTLSMMVNTKVREVGVLISMGSTAGDIVVLFMLCGMMVSLVGISVGLALGLWLCSSINDLLEGLGIELFQAQFYSIGELPTQVDAGRITWLVAVTLLTGLAASVLPSLRAGRMEAVEALRQG